MLSSSACVSSNNGNERSLTLTAPNDPDNMSEPPSGGFFQTEFKKSDDLKEMLDSSKDSLKLEAMKRIIGMVAKGKNASDLFPAVVKNVVSKNIEVKKLVYVYLVRYAEEQQDLALLSISTFQRALKEPNQLIRASALRVLSSVRVSMIVPIVMLAIREASSDMSPYVRKTAAHAIPKLYSLESEHKPELIEIIQKLLADRTVLVVGSAVMAFTEVCPERVDLIHQVYRKLCNVLVDVDEWGQVVIINMLTRYARSQFRDPNTHENRRDSDPPVYDSGSDVSEAVPVPPPLDPDLRLLIRSTRPLLQSRNAAVVMAVAQLYHHCAPKSEAHAFARALVRLLRSHTEVQCVVLDCIAAISSEQPATFEPYLKSFFIRTYELGCIKMLKLDILTNLVKESNVSVILRELQAYVSSSDKTFVAATIQAIGRCACSITDVTESCLNGLVSLLSNKNEAVVAESVVVIKRLLQSQSVDSKEIILQMTRLMDNITVAQARAAILWLLGEHCNDVPRIAPDVLRKVAKTFPEEKDIVKFQVLNLAVKLWLTNPEQTGKICQYVFNLAKYDQNYDIRDRTRLLKHFVRNAPGRIRSQTRTIFLTPKPAPLPIPLFRDRHPFQLGTLSHFINARATGYEPLPDFPEHPPPGDLRDVEPIPVVEEAKPMKMTKKELFSFESEEETSQASNSSASSSSSDDEEDEEAEDDDDDDEEDDDEEEEEDEESSSSLESEITESKSKSGELSSSSEGAVPSEMLPINEQNQSNAVALTPKRSNLDLLLDLDEIGVAPVMTPSLGGFLTPGPPTIAIANDCVQSVPPNFIPTKGDELLNRINGGGLGITYRFTRNPHLFSPNMVNVNLVFSNSTQDDITDIGIGEKILAVGSSVHEFAHIPTLAPNCNLAGTLGVDFNDSTQPVVLVIHSSLGSNKVSLKPPIGELLRPVTMSEEFFLKEQGRLKGMNEHSVVIPTTDEIVAKMFHVFNIGECQHSNPDTLRFAGQTLTYSSLVLITLAMKNDAINVTVNCEKMIIGSMVLNEIKTLLK